MTGQPTFPTLLEGFFTRRLMQQRQASAHTIASYRDTFRLLLQFAQKRLRREPSALVLEDIDVPLVVDFLDELEKLRDVTARTRNLRLTAIHSFFRYVAFEAPAHVAQTQRRSARRPALWTCCRVQCPLNHSRHRQNTSEFQTDGPPGAGSGGYIPPLRRCLS
jgi:integrase